MTFSANELKLKLAWKPYKSMWHQISVPPKTILLKEGAVSRQLFKVVKGAVRVWFNHDGKEISFQFFLEGGVVCSVESFRKQVPSMFYIETIETCELVWISKQDLDKVIDENVLLNKYMMDWAVDRQSEFIRHFFSFLKDTPQQRYETCLAKNRKSLNESPCSTSRPIWALRPFL